MKKQLSSVDISYIVKELQELIGSRFDKAFNIGEAFYFQFYGASSGKRILKVTDKFLYLASVKPESSEPPGFCMYLRKALSGMRLLSVSQKQPERIVDMVFESREARKTLVFELFGGGNILVLDAGGKILFAEHYEKFKGRDVLAKTQYRFPHKDYDIFSITPAQLAEAFKGTDKREVVKCLAIDLGLGGTYSEEVCVLSGVCKDMAPGSIGNKEVNAVFQGINFILNQKPSPAIVYGSNAVVDIVPFLLRVYCAFATKGFNTFCEAMDFYFSVEHKEESNERKAFLSRLAKIQRRIREQEETILGLAREEQSAREMAELIYVKYSLVQEVIRETNKALNKHSWQEIKDRLKGHNVIREVNAKDKAVTLEL